MIGRAGIKGSIYIKELEVGLSKRPRGYSLDEILALGGNGCSVTTTIQNKTLPLDVHLITGLLTYLVPPPDVFHLHFRQYLSHPGPKLARLGDLAIDHQRKGCNNDDARSVNDSSLDSSVDELSGRMQKLKIDQNGNGSDA
jgi:hypothetical protein